MFSPRTLTVLAVLVALCGLSTQTTCPGYTCSSTDPNLPTLWLYTTQMAASVHGTTFSVYPLLNDGTTYSGAYASMSVAGLQELQPFSGTECDDATVYPNLSNQSSNVLRDYQWSAMCCDVVTSWDMLTPTVNRSTAGITITDPLNPNFVLYVNFSIVNESVTFPQPGSEGTHNMTWEKVYSKDAAKITMSVFNPPWVGPQPGSPSYLKFFFTGKVQLPEMGEIVINDDVLQASYYGYVPEATVGLEFSKVFTVDGADHVIAFSTRHDLNGSGQILNSGFLLYACQDGYTLTGSETYWTNFTYDPTLTALFSGTQPTPASNGVNPAAYVVPIVVIAVALAIAGVFIMVPSARHLIRPQKTLAQRQASAAIEQDPEARHTSDSPPASAPKKETAHTSGWVRATKVPEH